MNTDDVRVVRGGTPGARRWALAAAALFSTAAAADTLTLHNGDRLTGRILHMSPSTVVFETTWAGELKIPRYEVRAIESDKPVTVLREHARAPETVTLRRAADGHVTLADEPAGTAPGADAGRMPPHDAAAAPSHDAAGAPAGDAAGSRAERARASPTVPITALRYINPRPEESGRGASYAGRVNVSGTASRGNHDANRLYAEGDVSARSREWRAALTGKVLHERGLNVVPAQSNWLIAGNMDRLLEDDAFVYLRSSVEHDRARDLASRITVGGGYGRQLIDTGRTTLSLRAGIEAVELKRGGVGDESGPAVGWGLNFTHRLDAWSAELFHDHQGFRMLEKAGQTTYRGRSGLRVPLRSGLTASLQVNHNFESKPLPGRLRRLDTVWLLGLGYAW